MEFSVGEVVGDRYQIQGRLGEGGMAVVYQAKHLQLGTLHALKVLTLSSRSIRDRMLQEGRFQAKLRHPNIVAVTDVVAIHDAPALVMELVDGPPLDELLRMQKLTLDQADGIARGLLAAVAHAHALGVVHRDLKPANILLEIVGQTAIPKVTDFGLAKLLDGRHSAVATRTGSTMGTPQYMSPEQIKDAKSVDQRADVFALGAILYELVTGDRAFDGDHLLDIFKAIDDGVYVDPVTLRPDARPGMLAAIEAGLRGDRAARAQSAAELFALWTDGESLPTGASMVSLGTLPSLAEFRSRDGDADAVQEAPTGGTSVAAPLMVGTGFVMLGVAGVVIVGLLALVGWLWLQPAETRIVEVEVSAATDEPVVGGTAAVDDRMKSIDDALDPDPADDEPADDEPADDELVDDGVPWGDDPTIVRDVERPPEPEEQGPPTQERRLSERFLAAKGRGPRRAFGQELLASWQTGPDPIHEPLARDVLAAVGGHRLAFLEAYGARGTSLQPPFDWMDDEDRKVAASAEDAFLAVACRQGTQGEARLMLQENGVIGRNLRRRLRGLDCGG